MSEQLISASMDTGENTYLGYGIDLINAKGPFVSELKGPLFKPEHYFNNKIDSVHGQHSHIESKMSSSVSEALSSLNLNASIKTGKIIPFFSGGLNFHYGKKESKSKVTKIYNIKITMLSKKQTFDVDCRSKDELRKCMKENFLAEINKSENSSKYIFETYGTHFIAEALIGGMLHITSLYSSNEDVDEDELAAAIDIACSDASLTLDTKLTDDQKAMLENTQIKAVCNGGDASVLVGFSYISYKEIGSVIQKWGVSFVNPQGHVLAYVNKYTPIWNLAATPERAKELEDAFYKLAEETNNNICEF